MKSITNNRIVVDLTKVQWSSFGYRNQFGNWSPKPIEYSSRGIPYDPTAICMTNVNGQPVTMAYYASILRIKDEWYEELRLKVTANCMLVYTGDKAVELNKAYNARIFGKKK